MAEHPNHSTSARKRSRLPAWVKGLICGEIFFALLIFVSYAADAFDPIFPEWFKKLDLPDTIGTICGVLAFPIALGGWLFIWGDGDGQPPDWINSVAFNVVFGLLLYGVIGALLGRWIGKRRGGSRS